MNKFWLICFVVLAMVNWQCRRSHQLEKPSDQLGSNVAGRPNIIFLLADDLRYDALGYTGNKLAITPNLDMLASQGTNFKNAYVTSSICAISRASILTGQYAKRHGIENFDKDLSVASLQQSYPLLLRNRGYYTGFIGKYGIGNNAPSVAFDYWKGYPGHGAYFYKDDDGKMVHETAMMGRQAKEFLNTRDKTKPFCLSISFKAPHSEDGVTENNGFRCDPYFNSWYTNVQFPYPATYADSFYHQFSPEWRQNRVSKENEARVRWNMRFSPQKFQATYLAIYRLVSGLDKAVGELRKNLKADGLDQNTIIIFTSDNGYYMGEHGLEGKWFGHEESIRVPLLIYDPRVPQQRRTVDQMVLNIDLAPTILASAGVEIPYVVQGKSLRPLMTGGVGNWRDEFFYEHPYESGVSYIPKTVGLVTPSWKYMRYYNGKSSNWRVVYEELYDVASDPHEVKNRISQPDQKSRIETYKKKVAQYEQQLR